MPFPVEFLRLYGGDVIIKSMLSAGSWRITSRASPQINWLITLFMFINDFRKLPRELTPGSIFDI
jgi:hypothetical protein